MQDLHEGESRTLFVVEETADDDEDEEVAAIHRRSRQLSQLQSDDDIHVTINLEMAGQCHDTYPVLFRVVSKANHDKDYVGSVRNKIRRRFSG